MKYLITCEHSTNFVPPKYRPLIPKNLLKTHLAYDIGAKSVARELGKILKAPVVYGDITRLIIDLNRSETHPNSFSIFSKGLSAKEKSDLIDRHLFRYSKRVQVQVKRILSSKQKLTVLSIHSFTPVFKGKTRRTDIGLLYRTDVKKEADFALSWQRGLKMRLKILGAIGSKPRAKLPSSRSLSFYRKFNIDRNLPYRGHTDCFINSLSDQNIKNQNFVALFIELNQRHLNTAAKKMFLAKLLADTIPKK
jgi:hypothetical protein